MESTEKKIIDQSSEKNTLGTTLAYGSATFADNTSSQFFAMLAMNFYFAVLGLNFIYILVGMVIFSIWNAVNDPLMGAISDRTNTKYGRRKPWIMVSLIPLCILLVLIWTPPTASEMTIFIYFIIVFCLFELFFTMFSLNQTALFPEMYLELEERTKANQILQVFSIVSLLFATVLPSFFIPEYTNPKYRTNFMYAGICVAILVFIAGIIFIKFGIKERAEFSKDSENAPGLIEAFKQTVKNKAFIRFVIANFMVFFVFTMVLAMNAIYATHVLGVKGSGQQSILLVLTFISAAGFMEVWRRISIKEGVKKGHIMAMGSVIVCAIPFLFISNFWGALIAYPIMGFGLSGILFFRAVTISSVIDYDEVNSGTRSEGSYYGINALITRLTTIAMIVAMFIVFSLTNFQEYNPNPSAEAIVGFRILMAVLPMIAMAIGIISMRGFPIDKETHETIKIKLEDLHKVKRDAL